MAPRVRRRFVLDALAAASCFPGRVGVSMGDFARRVLSPRLESTWRGKRGAPRTGGAESWSTCSACADEHCETSPVLKEARDLRRFACVKKARGPSRDRGCVFERERLRWARDGAENGAASLVPALREGRERRGEKSVRRSRGLRRPNELPPASAMRRRGTERGTARVNGENV